MVIIKRFVQQENQVGRQSVAPKSSVPRIRQSTLKPEDVSPITNERRFRKGRGLRMIEFKTELNIFLLLWGWI